ncbi:mannosyltransferase, partial [Nocardia sp. NPDC060255]
QVTQQLPNTPTTSAPALDRSSTAPILELDSRTPVNAIGGFTSDDPVPTLPDFQKLVSTHQVTYYLAQEVQLPDSWKVADQPGVLTEPGQPKSNGLWRPSGNKEIADWVAAHFNSVHIGNVAVYDLTTPH